MQTQFKAAILASLASAAFSPVLMAQEESGQPVSSVETAAVEEAAFSVETAAEEAAASGDAVIDPVQTSAPVQAPDVQKEVQDQTVSQPTAEQPVLTPPPEVFSVRLTEELSSKSAREGDKFEFTVAEDVVGNGKLIIPAGSHGHGVIAERKKRAGYGKPGFLRLRFESVSLPDGTQIALASQVVQQGDRNYAMSPATGANMVGNSIGHLANGLTSTGLIGVGIAALGFLNKGKRAVISPDQFLTVQLPAELMEPAADSAGDSKEADNAGSTSADGSPAIYNVKVTQPVPDASSPGNEASGENVEPAGDGSGGGSGVRESSNSMPVNPG